MYGPPARELISQSPASPTGAARESMRVPISGIWDTEEAKDPNLRKAKSAPRLQRGKCVATLPLSHTSGNPLKHWALCTLHVVQFFFDRTTTHVLVS